MKIILIYLITTYFQDDHCVHRLLDSLIIESDECDHQVINGIIGH